MKKLGGANVLLDYGKKLTDGLVRIAKMNGCTLIVSGAPSLFYLRIADDPSLDLHQRWVAECVKRGVYITNHHNHFINYAMTDEDLKHTLEVAEEAFQAVKANE
jgi:glutamate-1-semialdehyde 2,1-aminomutase